MKLIKNRFVFLIFVFAFSVLKLVRAEWRPPLSLPPGGQPSAPLDTSDYGQVKIGVLELIPKNTKDEKGTGKWIFLNNETGFIKGVNIKSDKLIEGNYLNLSADIEPEPRDGAARFYYDDELKEIRVSVDGGEWQNLLGAGGSSDLGFWKKQEGTENIFYKEGRVGIGTDAPRDSLDVKGNILLSGSLVLDGALRVNALSGDTGKPLVIAPDGFVRTGEFLVAESANAFVQGGNAFGTKAILGTKDEYQLGLKTDDVERLTIDLGGRVGIGNPAPVHQLDVLGKIRSSGPSAGLILENFSGKDGEYLVVGSGGEIRSRASQGEGPPGPPALDPRWLNTTDGKNNIYTNVMVGIKSTEPSAELDVSGNVIVKGLGNCSAPDKVVKTDSASRLVCGTALTGVSGSGNSSFIPKWNGVSNVTNSVIFENEEKIGIKTIEPEYALHVIGDIYATGKIIANDNLTAWVNAGQVSAGNFGAVAGKGNYTFSGASDANNPILFIDAENERFSIGGFSPRSVFDVRSIKDYDAAYIDTGGGIYLNTEPGSQGGVVIGAGDNSVALRGYNIGLNGNFLNFSGSSQFTGESIILANKSALIDTEGGLQIKGGQVLVGGSGLGIEGGDIYLAAKMITEEVPGAPPETIDVFNFNYNGGSLYDPSGNFEPANTTYYYYQQRRPVTGLVILKSNESISDYSATIISNLDAFRQARTGAPFFIIDWWNKYYQNNPQVAGRFSEEARMKAAHFKPDFPYYRDSDLKTKNMSTNKKDGVSEDAPSAVFDLAVYFSALESYSTTNDGVKNFLVGNGLYDDFQTTDIVVPSKPIAVRDLFGSLTVDFVVLSHNVFDPYTHAFVGGGSSPAQFHLAEIHPSYYEFIKDSESVLVEPGDEPGTIVYQTGGGLYGREAGFSNLNIYSKAFLQSANISSLSTANLKIEESASGAGLQVYTGGKTLQGYTILGGGLETGPTGNQTCTREWGEMKDGGKNKGCACPSGAGEISANQESGGGYYNFCVYPAPKGPSW